MFSKQKTEEKTIQVIRTFSYSSSYDSFRICSGAIFYQYTIVPPHENLSGKVGQLINVWVDNHYHHQGIATKMIGELIGQNQVRMIGLYSSKEVMKLYEKYRFIQKENYFVMYTE